MSRVRLVSDIAPTTSLTAGIVLDRILRHLPPDLDVVGTFLIGDWQQNYYLSERVDTSISKWCRKPQEYWPKKFSPQFLRNLGEHLSGIESRKILEAVLLEESRIKSDHIIVVIQGQTSIRIFNGLHEAGLPVSSIHWDPWSWWAREKSVPNSFNKEISRFESNLRKTRMHLLPSMNFGNLLNIDKKDFSVLYPFVSSFLNKEFNVGNTLRIAFSGQSYAMKEIKSFVEFLNHQKWKIGTRNIELHVFGLNGVQEHPKIIHHGWIEAEELVKKLQHCEMAFLPYPSSKEMLEVAQNSFPSKLATYVSASLPVIYIGPYDASVAPILESVGIVLPLGEKSSWQKILEVNSERNFEKELKSAYENFFSEEKFVNTLTAWLCANGLEGNAQKQYHYLHNKQVEVRDLDRIPIVKYLSHQYGKHLNRSSRLISKFMNLPFGLIRAFINYILKLLGYMWRISHMTHKGHSVKILLFSLASKRLFLLKVLKRKFRHD